MVARERLTEPRVTMKWLVAKPRSFTNFPAFLDLNGTVSNLTRRAVFSMNILNYLALVWLVVVRLLRLDLVLKSPFANRITQDDRKLKMGEISRRS